jgi:hypothetical protein
VLLCPVFNRSPGAIAACSANGTFHIQYEDGDEEIGVFLCFIKPRGAPEPPPPSKQMLTRMRMRRTKAADIDDDGEWCVGSRLEALDQAVSTAHVWRKASVLATDGKGESRMVKVHFTGWNTRYDEWLTISGGRLRQEKKPEGLRAEEEPGIKRRKGIKQTSTASEAEAEAEAEEETAAEGGMLREVEAEGSREVEGDGVACAYCAWGDDEAGNELLLCDSPSCDAAFHQRSAAAYSATPHTPHTHYAQALAIRYCVHRIQVLAHAPRLRACGQVALPRLHHLASRALWPRSRGSQGPSHLALVPPTRAAPPRGGRRRP